MVTQNQAIPDYFQHVNFAKGVKLSISWTDKYCISPVKAESAIEADQALVGQVTKILPDQGLLVRLPTHKCGLVALTDLRDSYEENPLENFEVMQLVR